MPQTVNSTAPAQEAPRAQAVRYFGRFQLLRLLGKSSRTMLWQVDDPRVGQELLLAMPRSRPADEQHMELWRLAAKRAVRIDHPSLAHVVEVGEHDHWPFITYERGNANLLSEVLDSQGTPPMQAVPWAVQLLEGLAFAHEAGAAHQDLQTYMVLMPETGPARLLGLGLALDAKGSPGQGLLAQRVAAERDVLAFGILMQEVLTGAPALDEADVSLVIDRIPPRGRELVRLPWTTNHPIPEALRAIVNRATDRQERQRYRNARTVVRALDGWLKAQNDQSGGPLAMLLDRMRSGGLLPAMPGAGQTAVKLAKMERERNDEVAEKVMTDLALSFELLRMVNSAQVRGTAESGNGPILTIRRAIDMLGMDGLQRAARVLRPWPGSLNADQAAALENLIERVCRAGQIAQWLRPAGYDPEVVYLLATLQNLGRLVVRYHFPEEAAQIERLIKPAPPENPGDPEEPGMSEETASFAVLGVDISTIGAAIGRLWGLGESVMHMMTRVSPTAIVHPGESDDDTLRLTASCANEVVDASLVASNHQTSALQKVTQRYGKALGLSLRDIQFAAHGQPPEPHSAHELRHGVHPTPHA